MARRVKARPAAFNISCDARAVQTPQDSYAVVKQAHRAQQPARAPPQQPACPAVKQVCRTLGSAEKETQHYTCGCLAFGGELCSQATAPGWCVTTLLWLLLMCLHGLSRAPVRSWSSYLVPTGRFCLVRCDLLAVEGCQLLQAEMGEAAVLLLATIMHQRLHIPCHALGPVFCNATWQHPNTAADHPTSWVRKR
eukprot:GHUV01031293.1.p1 GENE.GHUV01031293.1~~GHUV01031293.1.p1  ORF type:complete len:194 (-),score=26.66 GHUV01031293.1:1027-1608(-)